MGKNKTILLVIFLIFLSTQFFSQTDNPKMVDQEELELILKKCAEYCKRLENTILDFVCKEKITEEIFPYHLGFPKKEINTYIYDYQLVRQRDTINERRILLRENGLDYKKLDAQLQTKRFHHKHVVFGPIGLLGQKEQEIIDFRILKEEFYKEEKVVILEATPKFPDKFNAIYGKIWIRKKDFKILRIEWEQESMENFEAIERLADQLRAKPKITFVSEYAFEKNNIMFPSMYSVEENYILAEGLEYNKSIITVIYDSYKFFTVDTRVIY